LPLFFTSAALAGVFCGGGFLGAASAVEIERTAITAAIETNLIIFLSCNYSSDAGEYMPAVLPQWLFAGVMPQSI
jgi:hypothetical protein